MSFYSTSTITLPLWAFLEDIDRASLVTHVVKNLLVMQETQVRFLGWEDPLEKEMATHSSILAWRIPCPEEPGSYSLGGRKSWT